MFGHGMSVKVGGPSRSSGKDMTPQSPEYNGTNKRVVKDSGLKERAEYVVKPLGGEERRLTAIKFVAFAGEVRAYA